MNELVKPFYELKTSSKYAEALAFYKAQISPVVDRSLIAEDFGFVSAVCYCLRKSEHAEAALHFVFHHLKLKFETIKDPLMNEIGWDLTYLMKANEKKPVAKLWLEMCKQIISRTDKETNKSLYSKLSVAFANELVKHPDEMINSYVPFLETIDIKTLNGDPTIIHAENKPTIEQASDREQFYRSFSRLLLKIGLYDKCIGICEEVQYAIDKLSSSNKTWHLRRIAMCYTKQQRVTEAIDLYSKVLLRKPDWFSYYERAELYLQTGDPEKALYDACLAALRPSEAKYKCELFVFIGKLLPNNQSDITAIRYNHFVLAYALRSQNNWKISEVLMNELSGKAPKNVDTQMLQNTLSVFWQQQCQKEKVEKFQDIIKGEGIISQILHEGPRGDAFITTSNGETIYVRSNLITNLPTNSVLKLNTKIRFEAKPDVHNGHKVLVAQRADIME